MLRDLRYAVRTLRARAAVTLVAVLSLTLALGTVAGAVSLLDAFGFRPLDVADPAGLVQIAAADRGSTSRLSIAEYEALRDGTHAFSRVAASGIKGAGLSGPEAPPQVVLVGAVSSGYFQTLGVAPATGRPFLPDDDLPAATPVVILSHRIWERRFQADPGLVGRTIALNGVASLVVGILPRGFTGLDAIVAPDAWIPLATWTALLPSAARAAGVRSPGEQWLTVVARLADGPSTADRLRTTVGLSPRGLTAAERDVEVIAARLREVSPGPLRDRRFTAVSLTTVRTGRLIVLAAILWAIVALVVLVACANVAGLLLGRAEERRREMAIRLAIGASPGRLVRQLLTESLVLAAVSVAAGLSFGLWIVRSLPALLPPMSIPLGFEFRMDARVALITSLAGALTVVVFGLWPALTASRRAIAQAARGNRAEGGARRLSPRAILAAAQLAVSCMLIVSGGLLARSALNTRRIDPGFDVRPLLLVSLAPAAAGYDTSASERFLRDLVEGVRAAPGIERASLARRIPLDPNGGGAARDVVLPGVAGAPDAPPLHIRFNSVLPDYFDVMGAHLVAGRSFTDRDGARDRKVVVVNETMARRYWPGGTALGEQVRVQGPGRGEFEIVGIVRDGKINRLSEAPEPYMFFCLLQVPSAEVTLIVQAGADPGRAAPTVRGIVNRLDPRMPTMQMLTLADHLRYGSYESRLIAILIGALSLAGLILSLIGIYGVVSAIVASRTKEMGVRIALGARPADLLRGVLRSALTLAAWGVGAGLILALGAGRLLAGSLYGVGGADGATFVTAAGGLTLMVLAASWGPARRATRVDPIATLKSD